MPLRQIQCLARETGNLCVRHLRTHHFQTAQAQRFLQTEDKFWVVVFARAPCIALLAAGDEPNQKCTTSMLTWQLQSSLAKEHSQQ